jgi:septal ring factor EnvC (AmiA/AmiB activator)
MQRRRALLAAALVLATVGAAHAQRAQPAPRSASAEQTEAFLRQMGDAQKWMGEELWKIKEKIEALPNVIAEAKEGDAAINEDIGKLREEVKGLYVEISSVKQQIDELKDHIESVNANVSAFRTYAGFFLALVLLMVITIFVTTVIRR